MPRALIAFFCLAFVASAVALVAVLQGGTQRSDRALPAGTPPRPAVEVGPQVDGAAQLAEFDVDALVSHVASQVASGRHGELELYQAQRALAQRIAADPTDLDALRARIAADDLDERTVMVLLAAVGMAGSEESQAYLAEIVAGRAVK